MSEEIIEEIKKAVEGSDEKPKLEKAELLGIKFVTTEKGANLLNDISRVFDLVDVKQDDNKSEPIITRHFKRLLDPNKDKREMVIAEELAEEIENLSFYDGVILVWEIFDRIVDEYFDEDEKDAFGYSYDLGLMDKMQDILSNEVLNKIENLRKKRLHELFLMKSDLYKCPAWMRNDKNCIDTKMNKEIVSMQQE